MRAKGTTEEYELPPAGVTPAVCCDVVDLGLQETPWGPKPKVRLIWQIPEPDSKGRRHTAAKLYTLSLHEKANLSKDLESWRGRKFTEQERKDGFELENIVGVSCLLNIQHNVRSDGKEFANIVAIMPLSKGMPQLDIKDYQRKKDRKDQQAQGQTNGAPSEPPAEDPFGGPPTVPDHQQFDDSEIPF